MANKEDVNNFLFKRFAQLVVIEDIGIVKKYRNVKAVCDCGNIKIYRLCHLKNNGTKSCGCLRRNSLIARSLTHGLSNSKLFKSCTNAMSRCHNLNDRDYPHYSSRGIAVYEPWRNSISLMVTDLFKEIGHAPNKSDSFDRIDNNKGYEPGNIRWANKYEQANNRSSNVGIRRRKSQNHFRYILSYHGNNISYNENKWGKETAIELLEAWKVLFDVLDR